MQHIQDAQKQTPFQQEQSMQEVLRILKRIYEEDDIAEYANLDRSDFEKAIEEDEELQRIVAEFQPWWHEKKVAAVRKLPSFLSLSKKPPSEFIWNNLVELVSVYCWNHRLQLGDEEEVEFREGILSDSRILGDPSFKYYSSAKEALRHENIEDVICILIDPAKLEFCLDRMSRTVDQHDLIRRKLLYYQCWIHDELAHHPELTAEILQSLAAILIRKE